MDIIEMHDLSDELLDKADAPWFNSEQKDRYLNLAHAEFVEDYYKRFELDERVRKALLPLVRKTIGSNTSKINLDGIGDYMFTLSLKGEFKNKCGTGTVWEPISPLQLDDEAENQKDPFNVNDDENPGYTEENDGTNNVVLIVSENTPSNYVLKYLKRFTDVKRDDVNPSNNVNSVMPIFTHEEIVNIAVRKMMATTEQIQNYQLQQNEINQQK